MVSLELSEISLALSRFVKKWPGDLVDDGLSLTGLRRRGIGLRPVLAVSSVACQLSLPVCFQQARQ